jgi:hypothetical protein
MSTRSLPKHCGRESHTNSVGADRVGSLKSAIDSEIKSLRCLLDKR